MCCVRTSIAMTTSTVSSESRPRSLNIVSATTLPSSTWHAPARDAHARANVSRASSSRARITPYPTQAERQLAAELERQAATEEERERLRRAFS